MSMTREVSGVIKLLQITNPIMKVEEKEGTIIFHIYGWNEPLIYDPGKKTAVKGYAATLRKELKGEKVSVLRERLISSGADEEKIKKTNKEGLIALLLLKNQEAY